MTTNFLFPKKAFMFEVQDNSISNDANFKQKASKQNKGRQSGESPSAHLMHRIGLSCSDLPHLLIQTLFIMQDNEQMPTMAQKAISDFIRQDDIKEASETLNEMFYAWLRTESTPEERKIRIIHFQSIKDLLLSAEEIETLCRTEGWPDMQLASAEEGGRYE